jgi:tetratricopeptide (TPR) repeat protein
VFILQKIARQYSDLVGEQKTDEQRRAYATKALDYAERAVALDPKNAVSVLSLAICHGKLALYSDIRTKVKYVRLVHDEAVEAIALDPNYAWAHEVLGRWNYEVASLGASERFLVRLFFGKLPDASFNEAIAQIQRATELEPDELCHWLELGFAYSASGARSQARRAWERGLSMPSRAIYHPPAKARAQAALAAGA